jgi:hypothetical protein
MTFPFSTMMSTGNSIPGIFPRMIMMVSQENYIGYSVVLKYFSSPFSGAQAFFLRTGAKAHSG